MVGLALQGFHGLEHATGNKLIYGAGQQKVMIVGGPNIREDYHVEEGEVQHGIEACEAS